ncbi:MAG: L-histidine N(alpha)-methyltransferase [Lysobacterales bacterium CG02_land_8_20_14_3_00_62_12]|nr:MAG: L-histidine N(alpha)-methyltransferase [Xanthomonadales bacterium CG02_land_8_20_14_3_00_62_12]
MSGASGHHRVRLTDLHPSTDAIADELRQGLQADPKWLPSKYFYDAIGSALFEQICAAPEYYLTRSECSILQTQAAAIGAAIGSGVLVVEYGSGSGVKTQLLLQALPAAVAYAPVEISRAALLASVAELSALLPTLEMLPVCGDFTQTFVVPQPQRPAQRTLIFFPGSTIGNFAQPEAIALLAQMRREMGANGAALVGIDLQKDPKVIEAAYNDAAGVTARFTLNLLARLNRELGSNFDLQRFRHRAVYNRQTERIETDLVSVIAQTVLVDGCAIAFAADEAIRVEISCKYSLHGFGQMAAQAGLALQQSWTDSAQNFALVLLKPLASLA